jgi:hypothetical protein
MKKPVMLQFLHQGSEPSLDNVRRLFNLSADEVDTEFGVIATDPFEGLYTVLVEAHASDRIEAVLATRTKNPAEGIFSNPRIEPTGPPEE